MGAEQQPSLQQATRPSLRERQSLLVKCLGHLIVYATQQGYDLTLGEAYIQTPRKSRSGALVEDGVHMPASLHYSRLAIDLNLFVDGVFITSRDNPAWRDLGEFFESLDSACRWGGRFASGDANHFSVAYDGRA